ARRAPRLLEDEGEHRGRRRLPVRAGDDERRPVREKQLRQRLRERDDAETARRGGLGLGIRPADGVSADDQIDAVEPRGIVAGADRDTELGEERARGWI